jgi:hypothetical protein
VKLKAKAALQSAAIAEPLREDFDEPPGTLGGRREMFVVHLDALARRNAGTSTAATT